MNKKYQRMSTLYSKQNRNLYLVDETCILRVQDNKLTEFHKVMR